MSEQEQLRTLPKIDDLVRDPGLAELGAPHWALVEASRREVEAVRRRILAGKKGTVSVRAVAKTAASLCAPSLQRVVNATGVILHTNLGRAPLAPRAVEAVLQTAGGYCNLEYDVEQGSRGSRHGHAKQLLCELTGAEDALVVNNCAAAVMIGLSALAAGAKVIVSRGELVEIGGSFRIPDIMRMSGAELLEVGTTNKTRIADYEAALDESVGLLLKVHRSNFEIVGFTEEASLSEISALGRERGVATMMDLGSGALCEEVLFQRAGLHPEYSVVRAVAAGTDVVAFSGDKLLGGPQAGILVGKSASISKLRKHPLCRALRPDKMTVAALAATLACYRDGTLEEIPALSALVKTADELRVRAERLAAAVSEAGGSVRVVPCDSTVGGGTMPRASLASFGLEIAGSGERVDEALRAAPVPVVGRIREGRVILDVRTVHESDEAALVQAVALTAGPT